MNSNKKSAYKAIRKGLEINQNDTEIKTELKILGIRKGPVFPFLKRSNPLNKYTGLFLYRLGLR